VLISLTDIFYVALLCVVFVIVVVLLCVVGDRVHDDKWAVGYRKGRFKLVQGMFEDTFHCTESKVDALNCSSSSIFFDTLMRPSSTRTRTAAANFLDAISDSPPHFPPSTTDKDGHFSGVLGSIISTIDDMLSGGGRRGLAVCSSSWCVDAVSRLGEVIFRWAEFFYGDASLDAVKGAVLLAHIQRVNLEAQGSGGTYLFDLEADPEEKVNLATDRPEVVRQLVEEVAALRASKPEQGRYWMVLSVAEQRRRYAEGDCSMNAKIAKGDCVFKHPFMRPGEEEQELEGTSQDKQEQEAGDSVSSPLLPSSPALFVHAIPEFTRHMVLSFLGAGTHKLVKACMVLGAVYLIGRVTGGRGKGGK
jgi:hypothetical protein